MHELLGIHHITAIAGEPRANPDFYAGLLGLRLVKLTINFEERHITYRGPFDRLGERALSFHDPDGLRIEVVSTPDIHAERAYTDGPVPPEYAIHGFHSATLTEEGYERTAALLTETMGFRLVQQEGGDAGAIADVLCAPEETQGRVAVGTVHHIAWRTADDQQQDAWRRELAGLGYNVKPIIDRKYFHSVYFREPGGILFELATGPPGFAVDEAPETLGSKLQLPPWLESEREALMAILPPLQLPAGAHPVSQ